MIPEGAERGEKGPSQAAEKLPPSRFVTGHDFKACPERSRRMPIKPIKSMGFSPCGAPPEPFSSAIKPFSAACLAPGGTPEFDRLQSWLGPELSLPPPRIHISGKRVLGHLGAKRSTVINDYNQ